MAKQADWERDKAWADTHWPSIERIIRSQIGRIARVRSTGSYEDQHLARDYQVDRIVVACRLRRIENCPWRDMTIRSWRKSGAKTERDKIVEGAVRWYLYAWADDSGIRDWMLIDCEAIRPPAKLLPGSYELRDNKDGTTGFIALRIWWLYKVGALVDGELDARWFQEPAA